MDSNLLDMSLLPFERPVFVITSSPISTRFEITANLTLPLIVLKNASETIVLSYSAELVV